MIALVVGILATLYIKRASIKSGVTNVINMLTRSEFISKYGNVIKKAVKGSGLFPSLTMAQTILESSDKNGNPGNSTLAKKYNNYYGIKADKSWTGLTVSMNTNEVVNGKNTQVVANFRAYKAPIDSFKDRVLFLKKFDRYVPVFVAHTPEDQAMALQQAGYATDPNYANKLINLIHSLNLKTLDT